MSRRSVTTATVLVSFGLIAAGCGGETSPGIGAETIPVTSSSTTTTTVPAETTTTINFDREVVQDTIPIGEETTIADLAAVVNNMRGQTNNVSDQMSRLARFQELATPVNAQILDFSTTMTPVLEDQEFSVESTVQFRVPQDRLSIEMFLKDELRSRGWNKSSESSQPVNGVTETSLVFRIPGTPGDITELAANVAGLPGRTVIDYTNRTRVPNDDTAFLRLQFWQDELVTPRGATVTEVGVSTADDIGTLAVVYELAAETAAEARELIIALQDEEIFRVGTSQESGATTAPLLLVDQNNRELLIDFALTGEAETIAMTVSTSFGLDPID